MSDNRPFLLFLIGSLLFEVLSSYLLKTPINQYHVLGEVLISMIIFSSLFSLRSKSTLNIFVCFILVFIYISSYWEYIHPLWLSSGREENYYLNGYQKMGNYIKSNTSKDSVFLTGETSFRYYAERDTIWLNESVGDIFKRAVYSRDEPEIVSNLSDLRVDYVVVNKEQMNRRGVYDYFPEDGLLSIINSSPRFTKVFDSYNDGQMVLYKVNYYQEKL